MTNSFASLILWMSAWAQQAKQVLLLFVTQHFPMNENRHSFMALAGVKFKNHLIKGLVNSM